MSDSVRNAINRRNVLKGLGGTLGVAAIGGTGLLAATGSAAAQAQFDIDLDGTTYTGDQGLVDVVGVDATKTITWENFDVPVRYIRFKHEITIEDGGNTDWHTLYDKRSDRLTDWSSKGSGSDGWGGPGEYASNDGGDKQDWLNGKAYADVHWAVITDPADYEPNGAHSEWASVQTPAEWAEQISVDEDGQTKVRTIKWKTTLTFYTENENGKAVEIAEDDGVTTVTGTDRFSVTVTNEQSDIESSSTGSSSAE